MNYALQQARPEDVPIIFNLIKELAEFEKLTHFLTGTEEQLKEALFGERPSVECLVAWIEDKAVGYSLFFHNFSTFQCKSGLYLEDIYIKPDFRGQGIGKALFAKVQQIGHDRGCGRFEWHVIDWNERAIQFYKSMGATVYEQFRLCRITY